MSQSFLTAQDGAVRIRETTFAEKVDRVLTKDAIEFIVDLQRRFNPTREKLLLARTEREKKIKAGERPTFLKETESVRKSDWKVAACPKDLQDRRVEITGPVERKMMINALNSGAKVFMADIEDSLSPTWENVIEGQICLKEAYEKTLFFRSNEGKEYKLKSDLATLIVRPRGWHMIEKNFEVDGKAVSASLFDFALTFFHNAKKAIAQGTGPYFYLPKMESHLEARLWNDVFNYAQEKLSIPKGTIRATVLIETILAAFEMDEILFELKEHCAGLNAGRWDYIFSAIKKFRDFSEFLTPDRSQVTMTVPFMRAYTELLVQTCHRRGAHAMGGMAAFIPSRKDAAVNEVALTKVREDKERESRDGFDGTWVAHPDLVPVAMEIFDKKLGTKLNQKDVMRTEVKTNPQDLLKFPPPHVTETGIKNNISVALQYIERWLAGNGAVGIHNLMEDAATAEIARSQLWQWQRHGVNIQYADGKMHKFDERVYTQIKNGVLATECKGAQYAQAVQLLDELVLGEWKWDFLTTPAYQYI